MPKVSIITPCYNAEKYVGKTIESIRASTFTDWEHVVVDDGSTDNSAQVVLSYTRIEPRLRLIRQANGGVCNARNKGFNECSTESKYLLFFDADDCLEPQMLEVMVKYLDENSQVGFAYCDYWHIDEDDRVLDRFYFPRHVPSYFRVRALPYETPETPLEGLIGSGVMESSCVFRRSVYEKTSGWDECLGQGMEGMDLYIQFALVSDVHFVPRKLYKYRQHPTQSHRTIDREIQIQRLIAKLRDEKVLTAEQKARLAKVMWFYKGRLMPLLDLAIGTNIMRTGKVSAALRLYLRAANSYVMSFFPFAV